MSTSMDPTCYRRRRKLQLDGDDHMQYEAYLQASHTRSVSEVPAHVRPADEPSYAERHLG